ncbi:eukaryotic glutathione synthase, ATP binding domain-containing protein [Phthorimaea operculella]|nr:eukaryotic glutathione synthase, ATP binding domain-containing protein [Phthorimaea operculella]
MSGPGAACIPVPLDDETLLSITDQARKWATLHGFGMADYQDKDNFRICRFVLLPSPFPRTEYNKAVELQPILNELMHKVANDEEFLRSSLQNCLQDDVIANFWSIWNTVRDEEVAQPVSLGVFRSDYLLDTRANNRIQHVEINTHVLVLYKEEGCIITAHDLFAVPNAVVVFVVPNHKEYGQLAIETNITDKRPDKQFYTKTLDQMYAESKLNEKKQLILEGRPVSVVHFFWGFGLRHQHPTSRDWEAKLRIERSTAIKCPSIQYYLAGTKKVQQALAEPGVLEKFLSDPDKIGKVRDTLVGSNSLDFDDSGERAVQMALDDPNRFVLKSEGEGGGNNVFGAELKEVLTKMKHWIHSHGENTSSNGYIVSPDASVPPLTDLVAELGIYGVMISTGERMISNQASG